MCGPSLRQTFQKFSGALASTRGGLEIVFNQQLTRLGFTSLTASLPQAQRYLENGSEEYLYWVTRNYLSIDMGLKQTWLCYSSWGEFFFTIGFSFQSSFASCIFCTDFSTISLHQEELSGLACIFCTVLDTRTMIFCLWQWSLEPKNSP